MNHTQNKEDVGSVASPTVKELLTEVRQNQKDIMASIAKIPTTSTPPVTPAPQPQPNPGPSTDFSKSKVGVNIAGADFGTMSGNNDGNFPGVINKDYTYSQPQTPSELSYYVKKGIKTFRFPIKMERFINALGDTALRQDDSKALLTFLDNANAAGGKVLIEFHNYGRWRMGTLQLNDSGNFASIWKLMAQTYGTHPALYGYELMNEPHDMDIGVQGWAQLVQAAINAIRTVDKTHIIFVPGYDWQSAERWPQSSDALKSITDPSNNLAYSGHLYFDADGSGNDWGTPETQPETIGVNRLKPFTDWLVANNKKGAVTEFGYSRNRGAEDDATYAKNMAARALRYENFLKFAVSNPNIILLTAWAGGLWWGKDAWNTSLSIEPDQYGKDSDQALLLSKYASQ